MPGAQQGVVPPAAGSPLLIGALSVTASLLVGAVIAWHLGILDFNPRREPRSSRGSSGSGGACPPAGHRRAPQLKSCGHMQGCLPWSCHGCRACLLQPANDQLCRQLSHTASQGCR